MDSQTQKLEWKISIDELVEVLFANIESLMYYN